ncbi:MAG TPA: hypothetical protein VHZ97_10620 [Pseudonocardiaceae bacterium]|nr:hypothetical protein [Pseudonocardiaceae bacterium]
MNVRADGQPSGSPSTDETTELPADPAKPAKSARVRDLGALALVGVVLVCGITLIFGFLNKDRCTGPAYDSLGRTESFLRTAYRDVCYSDIQYLWVGRDIDRHVFPYVDGDITKEGQLTGGSVEYPVLTGLLMWLGAYYAHNDHEFLVYSALLLAPFGLFAAWALGRLARWRALIWALGPPLVLYAFHNWDLAAVACAVGAVYVLHRGWGRAGRDRPLVQRATFASVLLGLGFAFKLYPAIFVVPLMFYVLTGGFRGHELPAGKRRDVAGMIRVGVAAIVTALAANLPFMLAGFRGWKASFTFQELRQVDITTNSLWFWAFRPESDPTDLKFQNLVSLLSPLTILVAFAVACVIGWLRFRKEGTYPWMAVSAAMLCGFLLFHKVHSPQYTLWLVPMFVLMRVRWTWLLAYAVADIALGVGIFRYFYGIEYLHTSGIYSGFAEQATVIGIWGQVALLVCLFFVFGRSKSTVDEFDERAELSLPSRIGEPAPA